MNAPATYVSVSTSSATSTRRWRVIHRGQPLCADRDTAIEALQVYDDFAGRKTAVPLWDADRAAWDELVSQ